MNNIGEIEFINKNNFELNKTDGGFISLKMPDGNIYDRVNFYRAFPLTRPDEFISIRDIDKNEIGIIRNLNDLNNEYIALIKFDLDRRYFTPEINKINTVKDEYGYVYMDVDTSSGTRNITVPNGSTNFVRLSEERLILIDIDGNRYNIKNYMALDDKSVRLLETLI